MRRRTPYDVRDRVVLVTGAAAGFGAGLARRLARAGAKLALLDVDEPGLAALAAEIGDRAAWWPADVRDRGALDAAVDAAAARFGGIDVAVANAGVISFGSVAGLDPAEFERVVDVNLLGTWRTLRAAVPHVVRRQQGYLLAVSSLAAGFRAPLQAHYAASKAGVAALADALRLELRDSGARVGVIHPTFAGTAMVSRATRGDPAGRELWAGNTGLWAPVEPERVVAAMERAIARRSRLVVVPGVLTPLVVAPGLTQPLVERLLPRHRVRRALAAAAARDRPAAGRPDGSGMI